MWDGPYRPYGATISCVIMADHCSLTYRIYSFCSRRADASDTAPAPTASPLLDTPPESRVAEEEAAEVMKSRGESDASAAHRAYLLLDAELAAAASALTAEGKSTSPSSSSVSALSRSTAEALLSWIRCKTAGNGLVVADDGQVATSDTKERQQLWSEHAPRVLQLVKDVGEEPSSDPEVCVLVGFCDAFLCAGRGTVQQDRTPVRIAYCDRNWLVARLTWESMSLPHNNFKYTLPNIVLSSWEIELPSTLHQRFLLGVQH